MPPTVGTGWCYDYKVNLPEGEALKPILALPAVKAGLGLYDIT